MKRAMQRNRYRSSFWDLSSEVRLETRKGLIIKTSKRVSQYSLSGRKIKTFFSAAEAERQTGICSNIIRCVAGGRGMTAGGFVWQWGSATKIKVKSLEDRKRERRERNGQKVTQYTLKGEKIAQYPSLQDAAEATGCKVNSICLTLKGIFKSVNGYFWKKGYGEERIDLSGYKWGKGSMAATRTKKVKQYSIDGKYIQAFTNAKEAARSINMSKVKQT